MISNYCELRNSRCFGTLRGSILRIDLVKPIFCATIWSKSPEIAQNPYLAAACCRDVFDPSKLLEDLIYYRCFQIYTPIKQVKVS